MPIKRKTLAEFFWLRVRKTSGCWIWTGRIATFGYGDIQLYQGAKHILAHRASWVIHKGAIPAGLNVCHSCDVPACVNPEHLFIGTQGDNVRDAWAKGRMKLPHNERRDRCPQGHVFDERNTYFYDGGGRHRPSRICRICRALAEKARRQKRGEVRCAG